MDEQVAAPLLPPMWAPKLTGLAAAKALGYIDPNKPKPNFASRTEMLDARRVASGGLPRNAQPNTNLVRDVADPSVDWVDEPKFKTRSSLLGHRKDANVEQLLQQAEESILSNRLDANARVQKRIDENVQFLLSARKGRTRAELLASRRKARIAEAESGAAAVPHIPVARFSDSPAPFWRLSTGVDDKNLGASHEELIGRRKWYAKPEVYSRTGAPPRAEEPFKVSKSGARFLHKKLSSGPRKSMRGYAPQSIRDVSLKPTEAPAPELPVQWRSRTEREEADARDPLGAAERAKLPKPKMRWTDQVLNFEVREQVQDDDGPELGDGIQFTAPLYSSFTKSGVFEAPKLPKRTGIHDPLHSVRRDRAKSIRGAIESSKEQQHPHGTPLPSSTPRSKEPTEREPTASQFSEALVPLRGLDNSLGGGITRSFDGTFGSMEGFSSLSALPAGPRMSSLISSVKRGPSSLADATVRSGGFQSVAGLVRYG